MSYGANEEGIRLDGNLWVTLLDTLYFGKDLHIVMIFETS